MSNKYRVHKTKSIYENVENQYKTYCSISEACKAVGIHRSYYYKICRKLNMPSVASTNHVALTQTGGNLFSIEKNMNTYNINEQYTYDSTNSETTEDETKEYLKSVKRKLGIEWRG